MSIRFAHQKRPHIQEVPPLPELLAHPLDLPAPLDPSRDLPSLRDAVDQHGAKTQGMLQNLTDRVNQIEENNAPVLQHIERTRPHWRENPG